MKKLMIAAAAAAMIGGAYAYIPSAPNSDCVTDETTCEPAVFKLTANGKVSMNMGDYKTVQSLKVSKGLIVAKLGRANYQVAVSNNGFRVRSQDSNGIVYTYPDVTVALTNGVANAQIVRSVPAFVKEKLSAKFTDLAALNAAFKGATASFQVIVKDVDGNTVRIGEQVATFQYANDLDAFVQEPMTWITNQDGDEYCQDCFETADIYVNAKAGKTSYGIKYTDVEIMKWSIFGKKYADYIAVAGDGETKYSYSLETEMALKAEDFAGNEGLIDAASLYMVGFGTTKLAQYAATSKSKICTNGVCIPEQSATIKFNGWFVGWYDTGSTPYESDYTCDASCYFLYGGTWSATYDKALSEKFIYDDNDSLAEDYIGKELDEVLE